jgi:hypothetical protein
VDDRGRLIIRPDFCDEGLVNLDFVERERLEISPTIADPNVILTNPIVAAMTAAPIKPERMTTGADM